MERSLSGRVQTLQQLLLLSLVLLFPDAARFIPLLKLQQLPPDASWIKKERWEKLTLAQKESFAPLCPDFIIELKSKSDSLKTLQLKMQEWLDNGCRLAWLIDIDEQKIYVCKPTQEVTTINGFNTLLSGQDVLPGFELDLKELKS